jgi:2-polyprenyl-3-methyl-5-hydroxy-6-metoxy-1,4-benzoquinol methylase
MFVMLRRLRNLLHRTQHIISNNRQHRDVFCGYRPNALSQVDEAMLNYVIDFTGLSRGYIESCIRRKPGYTYVDEFRMRSPKDDTELEWFYVTSEKYIFANIIHRPWTMISEMLPAGSVLDYGAGVGTDILPLARKGYETHYFDINLVQREFVQFVCAREGLSVTFIRPYFNGKFDPIHCIQGRFDAVITRSLLEHVPYYSDLINHLVSCLNPNGLFLEASKFGNVEKDPMHLEEGEPIPDIMEACGMKLIRDESPHRCWQKQVVG